MSSPLDLRFEGFVSSPLDLRIELFVSSPVDLRFASSPLDLRMLSGFSAPPIDLVLLPALASVLVLFNH